MILIFNALYFVKDDPDVQSKTMEIIESTETITTSKQDDIASDVYLLII